LDDDPDYRIIAVKQYLSYGGEYTNDSTNGKPVESIGIRQLAGVASESRRAHRRFGNDRCAASVVLGCKRLHARQTWMARKYSNIWPLQV